MPEPVVLSQLLSVAVDPDRPDYAAVTFRTENPLTVTMDRGRLVGILDWWGLAVDAATVNGKIPGTFVRDVLDDILAAAVPDDPAAAM